MAALEDRVRQLEGQIARLLGGLRLGPQQAGPMPGWFRASRIEGNQMLINMVDSKVGVAPRISVTDTSGTTRAEMGNLDRYVGPNGVVSPAMYGFRANDATGNAIFDSLGLIAVMSQIGTNTQTVGPLTGAAGPPLGLSGTGGEVILATMTFTMSRTANVFLFAIASDYVSCTGAHVTAHPVYFQIDGTSNAVAYGFMPVFASAGEVQRAMTTALGLVQSFSAGSHTVSLIWNSEEGATDTCFNSNNVQYAFQMGA